MKEAQMNNPNQLGHFHRDIAKVIKQGQYNVTIELSCGHIKQMSRQAYNKYKNHATLCCECTNQYKV